MRAAARYGIDPFDFYKTDLLHSLRRWLSRHLYRPVIPVHESRDHGHICIYKDVRTGLSQGEIP